MPRKQLVSLVVCTVVLAISVEPIWAVPNSKKPGGGGGNGGGGGKTYRYTLTDLLGFSSQGYQSRAYYLTHRDVPVPDQGYVGGNVLIYGVSRIHVNGRAEFHPARWRVDASGSFPATDPLDSGLPGGAREVETMGLSALGYGVVRTNWSGEQDEDGQYVFPSYVDFFDGSYVELADVDGGRNTEVKGANNLGQLIGFGGASGLLWQLDQSGLPGDPVDLGLFDPRDINDFGVMAGTYGGYMAIAWFAEGALNVKVLGTTSRSLGANVHALNDFAVADPRLAVVGSSWLNEAGEYKQPDSVRGIVWRPNNLASSVTVIGTLGGSTSYALDVNASGEVVGHSSGSRGGQFAFVYRNGTLVNLNDQVELGAQTLNQATAINDDGDIVGFMQYPRPISEQRAFLLRPISTQ